MRLALIADSGDVIDTIDIGGDAGELLPSALGWAGRELAATGPVKAHMVSLLAEELKR